MTLSSLATSDGDALNAKVLAVSHLALYHASTRPAVAAIDEVPAAGAPAVAQLKSSAAVMDSNGAADTAVMASEPAAAGPAAAFGTPTKMRKASFADEDLERAPERRLSSTRAPPAPLEERDHLLEPASFSICVTGPSIRERVLAAASGENPAVGVEIDIGKWSLRLTHSQLKDVSDLVTKTVEADETIRAREISLLLADRIPRPVLDDPYVHVPRARWQYACLLYTSPSPRDATLSRMPSSA